MLARVLDVKAGATALDFPVRTFVHQQDAATFRAVFELGAIFFRKLTQPALIEGVWGLLTEDLAYV